MSINSNFNDNDTLAPEGFQEFCGRKSKIEPAQHHKFFAVVQFTEMRVLTLVICCSFLFSCNSKQQPAKVSGDWEKQEAVFFTYTDDPEDSLTTKNVLDASNDFIEVVSKKLKVYLLVSDTHDPDSLIHLFALKKYNTANIQIIPVKDLFSMGVTRDYGPIIIKNHDGTRSLLQFDWNYVGANLAKPDTSWENWKNATRDGYFKQMGKLLKMDIIRSDLMIEGGEIEMNGKGTAMLVEAFTKPRNPQLTADAFDSSLEKTLGLSNIIWLKEGIAEDASKVQSYKIFENTYGFGVGGHIDEFARFANSQTILLAFPDSAEAETDPIKKINYKRMKANYDILSVAKDHQGDLFTIVKIPMPDVIPDTFVVDTTRRQRIQIAAIRNQNPHLKHGDSFNFIPAVSYLNYVILNDLIIIPKYWKQGLPESWKRKDESVKKIFQEIFPDREVLQLNPLELNYVGGGFHCWTQQIPL